MAIGVAATALTGLCDGITSANIVGYTGNTLVKGKYNMIALPFSAVAGGNSRLADAMSGSGWFGHDDMNLADNIKVWYPGTQGYKTYYWWEDETHLYDGWYCNDGATFFDDAPENEDGLECGWTAWYLSRGTESNPAVTFSGAVEPADDVKVTIYGGGYNLVANPFPTAFQPNADQPWWSDSHTEPKLVDWNGPTCNDDMNQADNIKLWSPATDGYITYYYWADSSHEYDGWYASDGVNYFEDDPKRPASANGIQGGEVFWYLSRANKGVNRNITFFNPTK